MWKLLTYILGYLVLSLDLLAISHYHFEKYAEIIYSGGMPPRSIIPLIEIECDSAIDYIKSLWIIPLVPGIWIEQIVLYIIYTKKDSE